MSAARPSTSLRTASTEHAEHRLHQVWRFAVRNYIWIALIVLAGVMSAVSPTFRNPINIQNVLEQNGIIGIVAMGMLIMMIAGGLDLSVGAAGGAVAVVAAYTSAHLGFGATLAAGLGLGVAIGIINGLIVARIRINSFITTFAIASVIQGILFVFTSGESVVGNSPPLETFAYGNLLGLPLLFVAFVVV